VRPARVFGLNTDDLLVDAAIVFHRKNADWANVNDNARENWELEKYESVKRVAIATQGLVEVAVVNRVDERGEENAVKVHATGYVIYFKLVATSARNLDNCFVTHGSPK
jgi:hypothetical protein